MDNGSGYNQVGSLYLGIEVITPEIEETRKVNALSRWVIETPTPGARYPGVDGDLRKTRF
jgi:hypothetical protein